MPSVNLLNKVAQGGCGVYTRWAVAEFPHGTSVHPGWSTLATMIALVDCSHSERSRRGVASVKREMGPAVFWFQLLLLKYNHI